jgi:hypothetical protein
MKTILKRIGLAGAFALLGWEGKSQGFVNLNFESTTLASNGTPSTVATTVGLPGWDATIGGVSQSTILYNNGTLGNSAVAIQGYNVFSPTIAGNFSAALTAGATGNASISQTGLIPADTLSLLFESYTTGNGLPTLSVTINGQNISISPLQTTANYILYGGDISSFADQTVNLAFTAVSDYPQGFGYYVLDNIQFSNTAVPEPNSLALSGLGCLLLLWRNRHNFAQAKL